MAKKKPDKSLQGKKPINKAKAIVTKSKPQTKNPSHITNKLKRSEMYGKYLQQKKQQKKLARLQREKETEELGQDDGGDDDDDGNGNRVNKTTKAVPKTLDSTREVDPTMVIQHNNVDKEVLDDEMEDEFAQYFSNIVKPKILVTTRPRPSQSLFYFIYDLQQLIPNLEFYPRKQFSVKEICQFATNRNYTHVMILSQHEKSALCNGMTISHLGAGKKQRQQQEQEDKDMSSDDDDDDDHTDSDSESDDSKHKKTTSKKKASQSPNQTQDDHDERPMLVGPTVFFKVSNVVTSQNIPNHGASTSHIPELNLHGFGTRLGHRVGRFLGSLFPHNAEFQGRQVVTFHNQRDYIFVRHHRYIFNKKTEKQIELAKKQHEQQQKEKEANSNANTNQGEDDNNQNELHVKQTMKVNLQELGPRFTLKLRWIQDGTFDSQFGEYEWYHKRKEMDLTRRKFHL